jgi:RNA polymerase sigma-70 factor (ECF subfamily)
VALLAERQGTATRPADRAERVPAVRVKRLVTLAQAGNRDAFEELYRLHFDRIYGYLQLSVGNRYDAEDLTNQTFIRMLESIDRFVWRQVPFSAWLFRIAHNLLVDHFRVAKRTTPEEEPEHPDMVEASAEDEAMTAFGRESMLKLIGGLSTDQQQVLTLKFGFDFANAEIAAILGKSEGAVKALQHRAICTLEQRVER